jgi:hypothetical protein
MTTKNDKKYKIPATARTGIVVGFWNAASEALE